MLGRTLLVLAVLALPVPGAAPPPAPPSGPAAIAPPRSAAAETAEARAGAPRRLAPGADDELERALADLTSASAEQRRLATRWLGIHAEPALFPRLAAAAEAGDAEVRARLARALGSDDRHLGLAALFLEEDALAPVGEAAIRELLLRWNPRLDAPPLQGEELGERFLKWNDELAVQVLRLPGEESLERALDLLRRLGPLPLFAALDSVVDGNAGIGERRQREGLPLVAGTWDELLVEIGLRSGLSLVGLGLAEEGPSGLLVYTFGETPDTGLAWPLRWCREVQAGADPTRRVRAARALGASGWPAAVRWLEACWLERDDPAALEGLLLAAGAGRVPASFMRADVAEELLVRGLESLSTASELDREARAQGVDEAAASLVARDHALRRAERIGAALGAVGPLGVGSGGAGGGAAGEAADGVDLAALVLTGWEADEPTVLAWRLAILEQQAGDSPEARSALASVLAAEPGTYPPAVLFQALRAWGAAPTAGSPRGPLPALGDPTGLLEAPHAWSDVRELGARLIRTGLEPPEAWIDPAGLPEELELRPRLIVLEWLLGLDRPAAVADHLVALRLFSGEWPSLPPQPQTLGSPDSEAPDVVAWREAVARHLRQDRVGEILRDWIAMGQPERVYESLERARRGLPSGSTLMLDRLAALAGAIDPLGTRAPVLARYLTESGGTDVAALGALAGLPEGFELRMHLRRLLQAALESEVGPDWREAFLTGLERALGDLEASGEEGAARQLERQVQAVARARPEHPLARAILDSRWPPAPRTRPVELAVRARPPRLLP